MKRDACLVAWVLLFACAEAESARALSVSGRVVDYRAHPVAGAEIAVVENSRDWRTELSEARVCGPIVRTDDRGLFEVAAQVGSTRSMFVVASKPGLALAWDRAPLDASSAGRFDFHLVMEKPAMLSGTVVDTSGRVVAGAMIKIHPLSTGRQMISNIGDTLRTDAEGRFELACGEANPVGWYVTACCQERGWAGVTEITTLDQPLKMALGPGVTVKGTVATEEDVGIPAARVTVVTHISGMVSNLTVEALSDANGAFCIPAVLPTDAAVTHRLCVDASGYGPVSYVDIEVSDRAGGTTDLGKIILPAANESLSGIVVDADDQPAVNIPIFLRRASRETSQPEKFTATDESGRFHFHRICKGPAHLQANFSGRPEGRASIRTEAGRHDIRMVLQPGREAVVSQQPPRYMSLVGKQLAQVRGLEFVIPSEAAGKPVLILFLDQQQRPSRGIVAELIKRTDGLKEKGIEVVAVQVAAMDRAELDRWFAEQKAPFKTQMLDTAFDKAPYAWGIRAVPWLILTDEKHVVVAEGFAVDELGVKMKSPTGGN